MIVDSSAVVAILLHEPSSEELLEKLSTADSTSMGAPTAFETAMVLSIRLRRDGQSLLNDFLVESGMTIAPFSRDHLSCAVDAFLRYGKGRHSAALNFGDCLSYAVAKMAGQPLLFVGADFSKTDLTAA